MRTRYAIIVLLLSWASGLLAQDDIAVISSQYDESNAVLAPDGKTLYFTIANHILNTGGRKDPGDVWYSQVNDFGNWSAPVKLQGQVNNKEANRVLGFSEDGLTMYLHGHYGNGSSPPLTQGISISHWNGRSWSRPLDIQIPYFENNSRFQSGHISQDGEVILLSIESYKTEGNEDIYVSFKNNGSYTEPKNLGPDINTRFQEFTPYLSSDKRILFFSSNGRAGEGSSDVYYSRRLDETWKNWSEPQNIGKWINTDGKDWNFLMIDKIRKILFISTRSSDGYGDVYILSPHGELDSLFTEPPAVQMEPPIAFDEQYELQGTVEDQIGVPISSAQVRLSWEGGTEEFITDEEGRFGFNLEPNTVYTVHADAGLYIPQLKQVATTSSNENHVMTFRLLYAEVGVTVNLENVLFKKGTANLLDGSTDNLRVVLELMQKNKNIEIELAGHTDNNGDPKKNLQLSKQRVKVIRKFLIENGISGGRVTGRGYGDTRPIASNSSEETRKLNRRVEFTIVKN